MSSKAKPPQDVKSYEIVSEGSVPIDQIKVVSNSRKEFDADSIKELANNIQKVGIINPITLRPSEKGTGFILVAGERRFRAAKSIGMGQIPARVMNLTDEQAEEIQTLENLHRKDLNPIEEAQAFQSLLKMNAGISTEDLASKVDKTAQYVYRAVRLLELPTKMTSAVADGRLTAAHGHQILRAPKEKWEALIEFATAKGWRKDYPTVSELRQQVERAVQRDLSSAYFPKDKAYANEQACTACPYNTGNQDMLFDGAAKGHCTNPGCFNKKTNQAIRDLRDQAKEKYPKLEYVGAASNMGYSSVKTIKKFPIVDVSNKKMKSLLKDAPEKFGFGILKPHTYSQEKKPLVVFVCLDANLMPQEKVDDYQNRDWEKERYVNQWIKVGLIKLAWESMEKITKDDVDDILWSFLDRDGYRDPTHNALINLGTGKGSEELDRPDLKSIPEATVLKMIYFVLLSQNDSLEEWLENQKVDFQPACETMKTEAEIEYQKIKSSQEEKS